MAQGPVMDPKQASYKACKSSGRLAALHHVGTWQLIDSAISYELLCGEKYKLSMPF